MITLKEFMEIFNYRITEGCEYTWQCYGYNAYCISSWNGLHDEGGFSGSIVFDTENQTVYEVTVCDYANNRAYRIINPEYVDAHRKEVSLRDDDDYAWDYVPFTDLEVDDDFIQKASAIAEGIVYDTRVVVPVDLDDDTFLHIAKQAHERDITINQMVEVLLREVINSTERQNHGFLS